MILPRNFRRNRKGIGTVFGMVFFLMITIIIFASFMVILNQNTGLEQTVIQSRQMDNDKANEQLSITQQATVDLFTNKGLTSVTINCNLTNSGTTNVQIVRLWIEDITTNVAGSKIISSSDPIYIFQQGQSKLYSGTVNLQIANPSADEFRFWFVTARGNQFTLNQLSEININNIVNQGISGVIGDFLPDYHSVQWAKVNDANGQIIGGWTNGWIIPNNLGTIHMVWKISLKYYGSAPITLDRNTMLVYYPFSGQNPGGKAPSIAFIVSYSDGAINPYVNNVVTVNPSTGGTPVTFYFGSDGQPNLNKGMTNDEIDPLGDMLTLTIYGAPPSTYAQSFPLFAIYTRPVPTLVLTPNIGRIGSSITASGIQYTPSSSIIIYFDSIQVVPPPSIQSTSGGILTNTVFTVPTATAGTHTISAVDANGNSGSNIFTILAPTLSLTPNSGSTGTQITVSGANYVPNSLVTIAFDGTFIVTSTADNNGNLPTGASAPKFAISATSLSGTHTISASDGVNSASAQLIVNPSIVINPTSGPRNSPNQISVSGTNFAPNSVVTIKFDGALQSTSPSPVNTDSNGSFSGVVFTVTPGGKNGASHTVTATDANNNIATATFIGTN
jgi:hypothetical protein